MSKTSTSPKPKKVSRTIMVKNLKENGGKFFTSTHVGKDGKLHTMNAIMLKKQDSELGYFRVWSVSDKGYRNINPQTIVSLNISGKRMRA